MSPVIDIEGLRKEFRRVRAGRTRRSTAVDGLDLHVTGGGVFGFLGPNGSGKTTTIRCLLGLVRPDAGTVRLLGEDVSGNGLPRVIGRVGAIVETPQFFPTQTARTNLELLGRLQGIGPATVVRTLERVGLGDRGDELVKGYSLGMRQRLGLAAALLRDPEVLILDEPANGLDPAGIREMRETLRSLGGEGRTVFVSSHLLSEIEQTCDRVAIVARGRSVTTGAVHEIVHRGRRARMVVRLDDLAAGRRVLDAAGLRVDVAGGALLVDVPPAGPASISEILGRHGLWVSELRLEEANLEDVFLELTGAAA